MTRLRRFGLVAGLLLASLVASLTLQDMLTGTVPQIPPLSSGSPQSRAAGNVYFTDTDGWYRVTDRERAVLSPYALRVDALPASLPMELGPWQGKSLPLGPEINAWFDDPEVALQREYRDADGDIIWLSVFGSRGPKSFRLFEHTPATCYPLSGWTMLQEDLDTVPIGDGKIHARRGFAANSPHELIVLYFYLWDSPSRDPTDGVLSIRVSAPILRGERETLSLIKEEFLPHLFTDVVPWRRF